MTGVFQTVSSFFDFISHHIGWRFSVSFHATNFANLDVQSWTGIVDKCKKLRKIVFSMECFTADFLPFSSTRVKICLLACPPGYSIFLEFSNFLSSLALTRSTTCTSTSVGNNLVPFHLWRRETEIKHEKVYKCFVEDCNYILQIVFTDRSTHTD